jgi:Golgi apyrase
MPPPTVVDPWLASRRFGIVIDAGSSGSRLLIYSWRDARTVKLDGGNFANSLPKVEKGAKDEEWVKKVEPGALISITFCACNSEL